MVKRAVASAVLLCIGLLGGCGGRDPGEPSFPRPTATPKPTPEYLIPEKPQGIRPGGRFEPMRPGGEVTEPVEIVRVEPDCRLLEGAARPIMVELIVTKEGAVEGARVLSKAPADAKAAILEAVRGWRFRPSTFNGRAVPVYFTVALRRCP
ncbi:MAG: energy transducer TonB [Thermoanaerobaculia bacterium]